MEQRLNNPKCRSYPNYGGRGIIRCEEWNDFKVFYEWAITSGYNDALTIERKNSEGNYEPSNCTWIALEKQAWTRRNSLKKEKVLEIRALAELGVKTIDLAERFNVCRHTIRNIVTKRCFDYDKE
jgi:hypothetical protein